MLQIEFVTAKAVRKSLTAELLSSKYRKMKWPEKYWPTGHCYVASEALYHLLGGAKAGYKPMRRTLADTTHWWLQNRYGDLLDPTSDQFEYFDYSKGVGCGFLTKKPSKRAQIVMKRARKVLENSGNFCSGWWS